jgi:hypothetical protein
MKPQEILDDIRKTITELITTRSVDCFQFGTTTSSNELTIKPKSPKLIIWCSINPREVEVINKKICGEFNLTHKENLEALYLYISLKDWD